MPSLPDWMPSRRTLVSVLLLVALVVAAWVAWVVWNTYRDLNRAEQAASDLEAALRSDNAATRTSAIADLKDAAASAANRTDGVTWSVLTHVPMFGDDATGVRALSESLDVLASGAVDPLNEAVGDSSAIVSNGRVNVDLLGQLQEPVAQARTALAEAASLVEGQDSSGFTGRLRVQYDDYTTQVSELADTVGSVDKGLDVMPSMLGGEGKRTYLLIFQNNAEIRATGGLPGSWARVTANNGRLQIEEQGAGARFPVYNKPIGDLTEDERAIFGPEMGRYFLDPNFTPDFPRAAEVFNAFWERSYPQHPIDGVVSIDVVGLSYLLDATGPVTSGDLTLTSDNAVDVLLNQLYYEPDPSVQDARFQRIASDIFTAFTDGAGDPLDLLTQLGKAAGERRFLVAPFHDDERRALAGQEILGEFTSDDGATPHVDVALNDMTASKMSYYLRYHLDVQTQSCTREGVQQLEASMTFRQTVPPEEARKLPKTVTGIGPDVTPGDQFVRFHVFGPYGGTIDPASVRMDGSKVLVEEGLTLDGRPAMTLAVYVESMDDLVVTWSMTSAPGQNQNVEVRTTPSVVSGATVDGGASGC